MVIKRSMAGDGEMGGCIAIANSKKKISIISINVIGK